MKTKALLRMVLLLPLAVILLSSDQVFSQAPGEPRPPDIPASGPAAQPAAVVHLANGEWAPYTGGDLPRQGCDSQVVAEAFALEGIRAEYRFYPWARSYLLSQNGVVDGTLEWADTPGHQQTHFVSSDALSRQQWVFFHRKDKAFAWNRLDDLAGLRIGLTLGYVYSDALAALQQRHPGQFTEAPNDLLNLRKLLSGRIDLFPMERAVGKHLIKRALPEKEQAELTENPKPLADFFPHLLLSRAVPENNQRMLQFNRGLQRLKEGRRYKEIMAPCWSSSP